MQTIFGKVPNRLAFLIFGIALLFAFTHCDNGNDNGNVNETNPDNDDNPNGVYTSVTFNSVIANGSSSRTTDRLTLTFSRTITGLTAADISLSGMSGVSKGNLSGSGSTYTLPVSGFTSSGDLTVSVSKTGYDISSPSRDVRIFYYRPQPIDGPLHSNWPFYLGVAAPGRAFDPGTGQYNLLGHFNVLVAENDMKPESIMPSQWQNWQSNPVYNASQAYRWTEADRLVSYADSTNTAIRGHVLFWHEQTPEVFFRTGNQTSAFVSKQVFYQRMEHHVKTVFEKYGGRIRWWDVANETVGDDGNPRRTGGANVANSDGSSSYTALMENEGLTGDNRYEWIVKAFELSREYADANGGRDVKLFLTEYGIENPWAGSITKLNGFLRLLDYLIANGAPIDGVGIQGHTRVQDANVYVESLSNAIDQITSRRNPRTGRNLVVQVCELDISLFAWNDTERQMLTLPDSEITTRLQAQAAMYRDLFDMFADKYNEGRLDMVLVWGLADGHSWLNGFPLDGRVDHPLLFDRQYQPKPAFDTLIQSRQQSTGSFSVSNPSFTGWGGLGGRAGHTFDMLKTTANGNPPRITYQFPPEASAYSRFTVSYTVTNRENIANIMRLNFSDRARDDWSGTTTFDGYPDHVANGSYTYTNTFTRNQLTIAMNNYAGAVANDDFTIVINSIEFHD